jgi:phosphosulfolactate phosphohydrolase-like enzyme
MTPAALADWIAAIRTASPGLSLTAVEVLLRVAAGAQDRREIELQIPDVDRATITRSLGLLRGGARLKGGQWRESPIKLLRHRPHPHIPGALLYSLTSNGQDVIQALRHGEITVPHPCST